MSQYDFERFRGDTEPIEVRLSEDGSVFPLTACSAKLTVSDEEEPTTENYEFQSVATVDESGGILLFPLTADQADIVGDYYYDVELTDANGKTKTIKKGECRFNQDITK